MSLVFTLGKVLNQPPFSIEILPGDGSAWLAAVPESHDSPPKNFLFVEGNLGIPQKVLHTAYLEAISLFSRKRRVLRGGGDLKPDGVLDIIHSSSVLLLANPAHQTALNTRKRLVLATLIQAETELRFSSALLTLREGSKQSILWHHRRWLLRRIYHRNLDVVAEIHPSPDEDVLVFFSIPMDVITNELHVTSRASETYPRNCFAWAHRSRCADVLVARLRRSIAYQQETQVDELRTVLEQEFTSMIQWVDRHVSDYTAMQYLCTLASKVIHDIQPVSLEVSPAHSNENQPQSYSPQDLFSHSRSLVESYPSHESLWMYLRGSIIVMLKGSVMSREMRLDIVTFCRRLLQMESLDSLLETSTYWHVSRFIAWLARQYYSLDLLEQTPIPRILNNDDRDAVEGLVANLLT